MIIGIRRLIFSDMQTNVTMLIRPVLIEKKIKILDKGFKNSSMKHKISVADFNKHLKLLPNI